MLAMYIAMCVYNYYTITHSWLYMYIPALLAIVIP